MKRLVLLFLFFFITGVFAIGFETDKTVFEKQELIKISGSCENVGSTDITAIADGIAIFSSPIECKDGSFDFEYQTSFLDHSGEWEIILSSLNEQISKTIFVKEKREGGFFLVRFLSPASGQYQKNQNIIISVEITDAGSFVTDAQVVTWGALGEKLEFQNNSDGIYILEYTIPLESEIKEWNLEVLAQSLKGSEFFGGIGNLVLQIESAPIIIEVIEPNVASFEQGERINFIVRATYPNNEPLKDGQVFIKFDGRIVNLEQITLEEFRGTFDVPSNILGAIEAEVNAIDSANNSGVKTLKMVIGCSITCFVRQYGLILAAFVIVILALGHIFYTHLSFKNKNERIKKERDKINSLIKDLQKDYFTKGVMPTASYKKNLSEYKSRLIQIEQEINELQKKEEEG